MALRLAKGARPTVNVIWIICPATGNRVSTGIETDEESFSLLPNFTLTLTCPDCGEAHPWADMQGYLIKTSPKYPN